MGKGQLTYCDHLDEELVLCEVIVLDLLERPRCSGLLCDESFSLDWHGCLQLTMQEWTLELLQR